uniref:UDP-glucuronosyltransferase n=1 Tax=Globodera pallida TaxID=36090 RepID=A0A183BIS9_GLOPA
MMFSQLLLLLIFLPSSISTTSSGIPLKRKLKILVYSPIPAFSHMQFLGTIADTLAEAGHEVHFLKITIDDIKVKYTAHNTTLNETKLATKIFRVAYKPDVKVEASKSLLYPFSGENAWPMFNVLDSKFSQLFEMWSYFCKEIVFRPDLLAELKAEQYDVAIYELFDPCGVAIFERIGVHTRLATIAVPLPQMSAVHFGIPTLSSFVPNWAHPPLNAPTMNFWERLINFYNDFYDWYKLNDRLTDLETPIIREAFGADFPPLKELAKNISLFFVNSNKFLDLARPISNKIIYIGGITDEGKKHAELDEKVGTILDNSRAGTVLFSFGTAADTRTLSAKLRRTLLHAFSHFPDYDFIWKLDSESATNESALIKGTPNVHTFEWLPQNAILKHPKLRAFITHCGQNSLLEAAKVGVPIVAIPLFADQLYNAVVAKQRGMAVHVDILQLIGDETGDVLKTALSQILDDGSFRTNAQLVQKKIALTPYGAKDQLVRWVEFAAEFPHLNELNMPTDGELGWMA